MRPAGFDVVRLSPSEGDGDADGDPTRPVIRAAGADGRASPGASPKKTAGARPAPKKSVAAATPANPATPTPTP